MKLEPYIQLGIYKLGLFQARHVSWLFLSCGLLMTIATTALAEGLDVASPLSFFTNVADRLLLNLAHEPEFRQEFGSRSVRLTNIMVWPTNDYTPAVHRTLQVAANLYDALTNHAPLTADLSAPAVFRPLFNKTADRVVITGYAEVTNANDIIVTMRDLKSSADMAATWGSNDMVYGVPLVIGARQGFPSFNALALETAVQVTRKLQVYRITTNTIPNEIRQLYLMSISNVICVAAWNSYTNTYPLGVQIIVAADVTTVITNEDGIVPTSSYLGTGLASNRYSVGYVTNIAASVWAGFRLIQPKYSFQIPLTNLFVSLAPCSWQSAAPASSLGSFVFPPATNFTQQGLTPPHWWMNVGTRLRFIMVDVATSRILDYVNLCSDADTLDITGELTHGTDCDVNSGTDSSASGAWCTNKPPAYPPYVYVPTFGILNQLGVSRGSIPVNAVWMSYIDGPTTGNDVQKSIMNFAVFMNANSGSTNLIMQAPFSPHRTIYQYVSWQVNDPLVHYKVHDLTDSLGTVRTVEWDQHQYSPVLAIGTLNAHYRPWGGNPYKIDYETTPATSYHLELKDPLVKNSDNWNFPTNGSPNLDWLGQVHRGTPWQTIYLKTATVDADTWKTWTGNLDANDSALTQPQQDWPLASLLVSLFNTNHPTQLLSPNNPETNAWLQTLDGMTVLSDAFNSTIVSSNSPQAALIADAINFTRANQPALQFHQPGDILATPELSVASPWLSNTNLSYIESGFNTNINDAVCEAIPSQLLPLLRADSFGQICFGDGQSQVEFTGMEGFPYAVEASSNLVDWVGVSTNLPVNGRISFTIPTSPSPQFYRSVALP